MPPGTCAGFMQDSDLAYCTRLPELTDKERANDSICSACACVQD